ncbi:hypothetical protein M3Y99_01972100 [Aphelenchoides fujianensis]|nr:hypothetical protein M3Y99_01972100 [Aphelenchoides fujianensis]
MAPNSSTMEAAVVKQKPRIRAALRDGLNRFCLVGAMETDVKKGAAQLVRLAAISRAHLASVRRSAAGIKFKLDRSLWRVKLNLGLATPKIAFPVGQAEMSAITRLLGVPVHLTFDYCHPSFETVDWKELQQIEKQVNTLSVYNKFNSHYFSEFVNNMAPRLKVLHSTWSLLAQFPPLDLEKASIYHSPGDFSEVNRHKILRLDVPVYDIDGYSGFPSNQVVSSSIKAVGILHVDYAAEFPYDGIAAFCRCFPSLEDLHIVCDYEKPVPELIVYFTKLWTKCFEIRDRLHVGGLKRLFITVKHDCMFIGTKADWFEQLKQVEPFHEATSTIDYSDKCVGMFLKHNEPRGAKPTFILVKGDFRWSMEEDEETAEDQPDDQMDEENEGNNQAMDQGDLEDEMNDGGDY